jgi:hypothetical protein
MQTMPQTLLHNLTDTTVAHEPELRPVSGTDVPEPLWKACTTTEHLKEFAYQFNMN